MVDAVNNQAITVGNGSNVWKWIVGVLAAALITGATSWGGYMMGRDTGLDDRLRQTNLRQSMAEARLTGVETTGILVQTQLNLIHQELSVIRQDLRTALMRR